MSNSLKASTTGLEIVDKARQRLGWTKTSTARWWQDAHTSRATLRRFWQGDRIQKEIFISICAVIGITNWENIADVADVNIDNYPTSQIYLDWQEAPNLENFYGRNEELLELQTLINNGCQLIHISGMAGIGKTSLVLALVDYVQSQFQFLIWKSIHYHTSILDLLNNLLTNFAKNNYIHDINTGVLQLIKYLQKHRCLLVLDGIDNTNLEVSEFIQRLNTYNYQSCIITTSQEKSNSDQVVNITLNGLSKNAALELLKSKEIRGQELGLLALIQLYRGNPLALKLVIPVIQTVFSGNIVAFINQNTLIVGDRLKILLKQQLNQLSPLETDILYWLAIWQEPISFPRLQTHLLISLDPSTVLLGIMQLEQKSLIEKWISNDESSFTLQPLVMKVVIDELVEKVIEEINQVTQNHNISYFQIFRTHWLLRPGTDDINGEKIIHLIQEKLWRIYGANLPQILSDILILLEDKSPFVVGYISCNLAVFLSYHN